MPSPRLDAISGGDPNLPPYQPSLFEKGTSIVFAPFEAASNASKSVVRAAQTGDTDYLFNAVKSFIPYGGSETVKAEEISGDPEAYYKNLAIDLLVDFSLPISGIGKANTALKLAKAAKTAKLLERSAKQIARIAPGVMSAERVGELVKIADEARAAYSFTKVPKVIGLENKSIKLTADALRTKGLTDETIKGILGNIETPKRSIVSLGIPGTKAEVHLGDWEKLQKLTKAIKLLPDPGIPVLVERVAKLQPKLAAAERVLNTKTEKLTAELEAKGISSNAIADAVASATQKENLRIATLKAKLEKTTSLLESSEKGTLSKIPVIRGIVTPETTNKVRSVLEKTGSIFRHDARKDYQRAIGEVLNYNIASETHDLTTAKKLELSARLNEIKQLTGETPEAFNERLVGALEAIGDKTYTKQTAALNQAIKETNIKFEAKKKLLESRGIFDPVKHETQYKNALATIKNRQLALDLQFEKASERLGKLNQEEISIFNEYKKRNEDFIPLAQKLGVKVEELQSSKGMLEYATRLISDEAIKYKKIEPQKYNSINRDFKVFFENAAKRTLYPELSIPEINKVIRHDYGVNFDFFKTDIADLIIETQRRQQVTLYRAAAVNALVNTEKVGRKVKKGDIKVKELFRTLGLDPAKAPKGWIPETVKHDIIGFNDFALRQVDKEGLVRDLFQFVDQKANLWRSLYTSVLPSFGVRNEINNFVTNKIAAKTKFSDYTKAYRAQLDETDALRLEAIQHGVLDKGQLATYGRELGDKNVILKFLDLDRPFSGTIEQLAEKLLHKDVKFGNKMDPLVGRAFNRFMEDNARLAHYIARKRLGDSPFEAARSVNKWLFDYSKLTGAERKYIKPLFTFYQWHRNNLPLVLNTLITHPRYAAVYAKITGLGKEEAPNYLRGQAAFKAPPFFGENQFIGSLGLGIEDLFLLSAADADPASNPIGGFEQLKRLGEKAKSQANPLLRIPWEIFSGRDFYRGRDLSKTQILDYVSRALPTSTLFAKAGKFKEALDDKTDGSTLTSAFVNVLSGLRVYGVSPKTVKIGEIRRRLLATGKVIPYPVLIPSVEGDKVAKKLIAKYNKLVKTKD